VSIRCTLRLRTPQLSEFLWTIRSIVRFLVECYFGTLINLHVVASVCPGSLDLVFEGGFYVIRRREGGALQPLAARACTPSPVLLGGPFITGEETAFEPPAPGGFISGTFLVQCQNSLDLFLRSHVELTYLHPLPAMSTSQAEILARAGTLTLFFAFSLPNDDFLRAGLLPDAEFNRFVDPDDE
jgi:hypothetical protein